MSLYKTKINKKSVVSPSKILSRIPDKLKSYFFLGFSDRDGCFYKKKNCNKNAYLISGSYEQDWSDFANLMKKMDCKYGIKKHISKIGHKSSNLSFANKKSILSFGQYVYKTIEYDNVGLKRKYQKFIEIKENYEKNKTNPKSKFYKD